MLKRRPRNPAQRLRLAVEAMPRPSRVAMLRGLEGSPIMAGAYAERGGPGICPMLAAHRNGGRTDLASFARSWDRYTGARRPRMATEREVRTLRAFLEMSLVGEATGTESLAAAAVRIRSEREQLAERSPRRSAGERPAPTGERHRGRELRPTRGWGWILPTRRWDVYRERLAAASEQLAEQRAGEVLERGAADAAPSH
jgi:hypothetical protein